MAEPATIATLRYGEPIDVDGVRVSLHPAGHILGSSQVRLERDGRAWVASGDYKVEPDPVFSPSFRATGHLPPSGGLSRP